MTQREFIYNMSDSKLYDLAINFNKEFKNNLEHIFKPEKKYPTPSQLKSFENIVLYFTINDVFRFIQHKISRNRYKEFYTKLETYLNQNITQNKKINDIIKEKDFNKDETLLLLIQEFTQHLIIEMIYNSIRGRRNND